MSRGILQSLVLPHCWVCETRFNDLKESPGDALREEHHVIPRAYGGTDGPTVSLCETHHGVLHKIAVALKTKKPYFNLTANHTPQQVKKLMYLATRVYEAELLTRNDPNKRIMLMLSMDGDFARKVDDLKRVLPGVKSRESAVRSAVLEAWSRHFMSNKQT
jgi:hypothetical protein